MTLDDILAFCNFNSTPDDELANSEVIISVNGERKKIDFIWVQEGKDSKFEIVLSDNVFKEGEV
jgi:hypothetical protein